MRCPPLVVLVLALGPTLGCGPAAPDRATTLFDAIDVPDALIMAASAFVNDGQLNKARQVLGRLEPKFASLNIDQRKSVAALKEQLGPVKRQTGP